MESPRDEPLKVIYKVLMYVEETSKQGLFYSSMFELKLKAYVDSDWVRCLDIRNLLQGMVFFLKIH